MRIAIVVNTFPNLSETFVLNQIIGLINQGHKVDIYTTEICEVLPLQEDVIYYRLLERTQILTVPMPENYLIRIWKAIGLFILVACRHPLVTLRSLNVFKYKRLSASLQLFYNTIPFIHRVPYDVVHCQFGNLGPAILILKQIGAITGKLVVSFRGYDATQYLRKNPNVYDKLFKNADLFLPVSESIKRRLIQNGCSDNKIIVHHSGVDCIKFQSSDKHRRLGETTKLLTIARLVEKKGIEFAITAVAQLVSHGYSVNYFIVGDGPLHKNLQNLINELGIGSEVKLLGWKNHSDLMPLLHEAHMLIAPSIISSDGDEEGIPNAIKEAMLMNMPVVSTRHSGIPELIQDELSGFLVPERDVEALVDRLKYLIDNPEICVEMGLAGRNFVQEHFDTSKLNKKLTELYESIIL